MTHRNPLPKLEEESISATNRKVLIGLKQKPPIHGKIVELPFQEAEILSPPPIRHDSIATTATVGYFTGASDEEDDIVTTLSQITVAYNNPDLNDGEGEKPLEPPRVELQESQGKSRKDSVTTDEFDDKSGKTTNSIGSVSVSVDKTEDDKATFELLTQVTESVPTIRPGNNSKISVESVIESRIPSIIEIRKSLEMTASQLSNLIKRAKKLTVKKGTVFWVNKENAHFLVRVAPAIKVRATVMSKKVRTA